MRKHTTLWVAGGLFWLLSAIAGAQTSTATSTATLTATLTLTLTATSTANATLTPPCSPAGTLGNSVVGSFFGPASDSMRGSVYTLNNPATVYSLTVYCDTPPINTKMMVGIYSGSTGSVGGLVVQSAAQAVANGWNGFSITPTYLAAGTYWLLYLTDATGYEATYSAGSGNIEAFTTYGIAFGNMPGTMPTPVYGTGKESIYGLYCLIPTNTATNTITSTPTLTPTNTATVTQTNTPTLTGTVYTDTITSTCTSTPTLTPTVIPTMTPTVTPNLSLTPSCGGSFASFGESLTTGGVGPVTASQSYEIRACFYNLPVAGTVQTMSLYSTAYSAGTTAEVALYTNNAGTTNTVGSLVAQSVTQVLTAGWNVFPIPSSPIPAGNYWLAYIFSAPVSYTLIYQTTPAAVNTLAYTLTVPSWTFDSSGSSYSPSYGNNTYDLIQANYCPGLIPTNTTTNTATVTTTFTATNTPTITATLTPTGTPMNTATLTTTNSATNTPTITDSFTITQTPTNTLTSTNTNTASNTPTITTTNTPTQTATDTSTGTATNTVTFTGTSTASMTSTCTPTQTPTSTFTNTPIYTYMFTETSTMTPTSTGTSSSTNTATNTGTSSPTHTATSSATNTATNTSTSSPTNTATNTTISSATNTATNSATNTATNTSTFSATNTATKTAVSSATNTATNSPTNTPTVTSTLSATYTNTSTNTATVTGTITQILTFTNTPSLTPTNTPMIFFTNTSTATVTPTPSAVNVVSMFPNPVRGSNGTTLQIVFSEPHDYVTVKVYTLSFRKIYEDQVNYAPAGLFTYYVDPTKFKGNLAIANGLYYVTMTTPTQNWMVKLLILR